MLGAIINKLCILNGHHGLNQKASGGSVDEQNTDKLTKTMFKQNFQ